MPSLDGYSLNEEIKKVKAEVMDHILELKEQYTELYGYIHKLEKEKAKPAIKKSPAKKVKEGSAKGD